MKKLQNGLTRLNKPTFTLSLIFLMAFFLASCGGNQAPAEKPSVIGTWTLMPGQDRAARIIECSGFQFKPNELSCINGDSVPVVYYDLDGRDLTVHFGAGKTRKFVLNDPNTLSFKHFLADGDVFFERN